MEANEVRRLYSNTISLPHYNNLVPAYVALRQHAHADQPEVVISDRLFAPHRREHTRRVTWPEVGPRADVAATWDGGVQ